jgi:hypothetical protein
LAENTEHNQAQQKKPFVIRETPAWLDQHQDWISDGARQLYKALRTLADQKTGQLLIPGKGWIRLRTVEKKAGMSEDTRHKYTKELTALGCYHVHRERVTRSINGRERKVLGQAEITVSRLEPPKAHKHSRSSTPGNSDSAPNPPKPSGSSTPEPEKPNTGKASTTPGNPNNKETEPQDSVSSTPGNSNNKNVLLHPDSSTVEGLGGQKMSESTTDLPTAALPLGSSKNVPLQPEGGRQGSPAPTAPSVISIKPEYQYPPQAKGIVETLKSSLRAYAREHPGENIPVWKLQVWRKYHLADTDALGIPFAASIALYEQTVREFLNLPPLPPKPKEAWENPTLDASRQVMDTLKTAGSTGCTSAFLADKVYGCGMERAQEDWQDRQSRYRAQGRIVQIIARLRKKKWPIVTIGEDSRSKRYVLQLIN